MDFKRALQENITQESIAYGYTLSVWGSGAFLLNTFQITSMEILFFIFGGVAGFAPLALSAYSKLFHEVENRDRERLMVSSMVHIVASLGTVIGSFLIIEITSGILDPKFIFLIVGINATLSYNLLLLVEELLYKDLAVLRGYISSFKNE